MAYFCPVAPIQVLEKLKEVHHTTLGIRHLLLTHHILEYPDRFVQLFEGIPPCTLYLDNSIVELGEAAGDEPVWEACQILRKARSNQATPHWIHPVLTDVMGDGAATREAIKGSYTFWEAKMSSGINGRFALMAVCQGKDWTDFCQTVDMLHAMHDEYPHISILGIPRWMQRYASREQAVKYVKAVVPNANIHLLGFSDDVTDDLIASNHNDSMSIDSAVPLRYPGVWTPTVDAGPRPKDWFETAVATKQMVDNLERARRMCA